MVRACGAYEKERVACAIHKLNVVVHAVVPPVVLLEATNAPGTSESETFHGHTEGKKEPKRTDKGAIGANKVRLMRFCCCFSSWGYKKIIF